MSPYRGERVYDPRTGRCVGTYLGPIGSDQARIQPVETWGKSAWTTPEKVVRNSEIESDS